MSSLRIGRLFLLIIRTVDVNLFCHYRYYNEDLAVTGNATIGQVQESLKRYMGRMHYVQKSLYQLFRHTQGLSEPKEDLIDVSDSCLMLNDSYYIILTNTFSDLSLW